MNNKFELLADSFIEVFGKKLFRIRAKVAFGRVAAGELGGYVEKEENVSVSGNAWVYGDARVYGNAQVYGDAWVSGNARVYGNARVELHTDLYQAGPLGSRDAFITAFKCEAGFKVATGCFLGTPEEFMAAVAKTHGDNKHARLYRAFIETATYALAEGS
jgi:hypothetical protein